LLYTFCKQFIKCVDTFSHSHRRKLANKFNQSNTNSTLKSKEIALIIKQDKYKNSSTIIMVQDNVVCAGMYLIHQPNNKRMETPQKKSGLQLARNKIIKITTGR
jgi:hypothetical protein